MDGLTLSVAKDLVKTGKTMGEISGERLSSPLTSHQGESSFQNTLKDAIGKVNTLQKEADFKMQQLATGQTHNVSDVVVATEKADIALKLMMSVRNKVIDAYQEIMKMQV